MKKFFHFLGFAILSLSMTIFLTSCPGPNPWEEDPDPSQVDPINPEYPVDPDNPSNDPTQFSGSINENTTWPDRGLAVDYVVSGKLYVKGNALLTIEPGVTIMFDGTDGGLEVSDNAGIHAVGTPEKPIVFTGPTNNPNNGSWDEFKVTTTRNDNRLEYIQFIRGGSRDYWTENAVVVLTGRVHMNNCLIDGGLACGLYAEGEFYSFSNNTIKNVPNYPVWIYSHAALYSMGADNTYINNGKNMLHVNASNYNQQDHTTLKRMSVPYYFPNGYNINGAFKYTIEPGTTMLFGSNQKLDMEQQTTFIADGTIDAPITIRGLEDEPGYWAGMYYRSNKAQSVMNYVNISGGGYDDYWTQNHNIFLYNDSRLTMTNCIISGSQYYGIALDHIGVMERITHSNVVFLNNQGGNVWIESGGEYNGVTYESGQVIPQLP